MPTNSRLTDPMFGSPAVLAAFSDAGTVRAMLDAEAALARAEAHCGVIPPQAAQVIGEVCADCALDPDALAHDAVAAGNLAIPFVKQLTAAVASRDAGAARFVHWGATSQDILDTALVLQLAQALQAIDADLARLGDACAALAGTHRATPMVGRTWLQHALPTTFGAKVAGWLDALQRAQARVNAARDQARVLQFGGAAGTLASLGDDAPAVAIAFARALQLELPALPWHAHRDRLADVAAALGMLTGTLGKMARDLSLMMQTEVAEVAEPAAPGRGGSSTMPHKRNPVGCAAVLAAATRVPPLVATMLAGMTQEHERALGGWQAEWDTLPQIVSLAAGAARQMGEVVAGLDVDAARMRANLDLTRGLILGEAAMLELGRHIGRLDAHHVVEQASRRAVADGCTLREALARTLAEDPGHASLLDDATLDRLADPARYAGQATPFADAAVAAWRARHGDPVAPEPAAATTTQGMPAQPAPAARAAASDRERYEAGLAVRRAVLGSAHVDRSLQRLTPFNAPFQNLITRYAWGEIWTRDGLPRHTRSLITIAMMVALNRSEELKLHLRAAANNGVTRDQIQEVLLQTAIYCGVPAANSAFHMAGEILAGDDAGQ
ncbi:3-carboxy-cis,cis-muconate cycloisomerase [Cupriavidus agavae]|uniref:3-carboxy-cis,cis-muconate cycloisomerase n=2 Tax=Cupriavidus agavae TaxID=1001822 RepID=A0A4Q7RUC3_9BURK|nr:3-carboxy-cis,cis-muconate cycloisomerase [Cupriavidus agavae]